MFRRPLLVAGFLVLLFAVPSHATSEEADEPPECSDVVEVNCFHTHTGIVINMDTGEVYAAPFPMFCATYAELGPYHRMDLCHHTPVEVPLSRLLQLEGTTADA